MRREPRFDTLLGFQSQKYISAALTLALAVSPLSLLAYDDDFNTYKPQSYRNEFKSKNNFSSSFQLDRQVSNMNAALQFRQTVNYASVVATPKINNPIVPTIQPKIAFNFSQQKPQNMKLDIRTPMSAAAPVKTNLIQSLFKAIGSGIQKIGGAIGNLVQRVFVAPRQQQAVANQQKVVVSQNPNLTPMGNNTYMSKGGQTFAQGKLWESGSTFQADNKGEINVIQGTSMEPTFGSMKDKTGALLPVKMTNVNGTITPTGLDFGRMKANTVIAVTAPTPIEGFGTIQPGEMTFQGPIKSPTMNEVVGGRFNFSNTNVDLNPAMSKNLGMDNPVTMRQATFSLQAGLMKMQSFMIEKGNKSLVVTENNSPKEKTSLKAETDKLSADLTGLSDRSQKATEKGTQATNFLTNNLGTGLMKSPVKQTEGLSKDLTQLNNAVRNEEYDAVVGKTADLNTRLPSIEQNVAQNEAVANTLANLAENYRVAVSPQTDNAGKANAMVQSGKALEDLARTKALPDQTIQAWHQAMEKNFEQVLLGGEVDGGDVKSFVGGLVRGLISAVTWPLQIIGRIMDGLLPKIARGLDNTWLGQKLGTGAVFSVLSGDMFRKRTTIEFSETGPAVVTINGIWNSRRASFDINNFVKGVFGVDKATRVENGTTGVGDFLQILGHEYLGTIDRPAIETAKAIRAGIAMKGEVYVVAHSQGTAIFNAALNLLSVENRSKIHYIGVGAEWHIDAKSKGLASAENIWNKADKIPLANRRLTGWLIPTLADRQLHTEWTKIDSSLNMTRKGNHHSFVYYREAVADWAKRMKDQMGSK